jgi:hypothetical protein
VFAELSISGGGVAASRRFESAQSAEPRRARRDPRADLVDDGADAQRRIVQPTSGPDPTSALTGASNLVIQGVCPGRVTDHIGIAVDSVSYAVLRDAMTHRGPARASRMKQTVCRRPYAPGLDPERTRARIQDHYAVAAPRTLQGADGGVLLSREPAVRSWVRAR